MPERNIELGTVHHVYNKSIAGYKILEFPESQTHLLRLIRYYKMEDTPGRFSHFSTNKAIISEHGSVDQAIEDFSITRKNIVNIIAYCIMPTHFHLLLEETNAQGIETFMRNIQNAYSRFYNTKTKRKGPLWEGRYKNKIIDSDEILIHITRYIHLNPVTSKLCDTPEEWIYSSYKEYTKTTNYKICNYAHLIDINSKQYQGFCNNQIDYQRTLAQLKKLSHE